jgi:hypothetical protein
MATALMIGATALSAYGQYQQSRYQSSMAKASAKVAEQQGERNAQLALQEGAQREASLRKKARAQQGTNIKNIAMSGVTMTGSPLLVMTETAKEVEEEAYGIRRSAQISADTARYQGQLSAWGYEQQAQQARTGGYLGTAATLMQGGSSIYKNVKINKYLNQPWWS